MRRQPGFFDVGERLPELSAKGDDLERTSRLINFEMFRAELERAVPTSDASKGGRPALVESLSELLRVHVRDVTSLGPAVLQRTMQRPDTRGYTVVKTRFGSFFIRRHP